MAGHALKTQTLMQGDNPAWVLCPGHVDIKTFNKAFKAEGWSGAGDYKKEDIFYEYWTFNRLTKHWKKAIPSAIGARKVTVCRWD